MLADNIKRFRLACYCPRAHDATSLYRAMGPLSAMERQDHRLELRPAPVGPEGLELSWNWLIGCDALFVQRPWLKMHLQVMVQAKMMGLPVWVDWDDDYAHVHASNPSVRIFEDCREMLDRACHLANVITVSTPELARRRGEPTATGHKFMVIPNAAQFPFQPLVKPRARRVCWRGGASHEFDLLQVLPALARIANDPGFGKWDWCFLGDVPWQVAEVMPRERLVTDFGAEPFLYMEAMSKLMPYVHIVPLADTVFNPAKSNLAWVEATLGGAVVLGPDWEEWHRPGLVNYKDKADFADKLAGLMKTYPEHEIHPHVRASRAFIEENLALPKVNEKRWTVLNCLADEGGDRFRDQTL